MYPHLRPLPPSKVAWVPWPKVHSEGPIRLPTRVDGARTFELGSRGHNTTLTVDPNDFQAKALESGIEHNAFIVACADPDVLWIVCQAPPMEFADSDGELHDHFFDFLFGIADGTTQAHVIKSKDKVIRDDLEPFVENLASYLPEDLADTVVLTTDTDLPAWLVSNARLIRAARFDHTCIYDALVEQRAKELGRPVSIAELTAPWAPRGPRSVARLLYDRKLRLVRPELIQPTTLVEAVEGLEA